MRTIYQQAILMIIWLGETMEESRSAFELIYKFETVVGDDGITEPNLKRLLAIIECDEDADEKLEEDLWMLPREVGGIGLVFFRKLLSRKT